MSSQSNVGFYRVDRFVVPAAARDHFLERVRDTHRVLRRQPGFVRDYVLECEAGGGASAIVTFVEWEDAAVVERVAAAVAAHHREAGFDRQAFLDAAGINADMGSYRPLAV